MPQTNADGTAGYAEGPGYFNYALNGFLPYVRARDNWISKTNSYLGPNETKYTNMFRWYLQILNPDGTLPIYDNTAYGNGNLLGVLGESEFPGNSEHLPKTEADEYHNKPYDMRGDYLLAMGGGRVDQMEVYNNASSGNLVIRNKHKEDNHSIHLLYEHDFAIDIAANPVDESHEDSDLGSITSLKINSDELLIDPGYLGWGNERFTNKLSDHSSAAFTHVHFLQSPPFPTANKLYENEYLKDYSIEMPAYLPVYGEYKPYKYTRNVTSINSTDNLYYVVNDKLNTDSLGNMTIRFNGTGN